MALPKNNNNISQQVLDALGMGVLALGPGAKIIFANRCAEKILGWKTGELLGKPISTLVKDQTLETTKASHREDILFFKKDNEGFPVEYVGTPIPETGKMSGTVITFQDISERKRVENQKDEFISNLSHELRSPLTIIKGAIWNLKDGVMGHLTEKQSKLVETTSRHIDKLSRLVEDILDISRLQSGKAQINRRRISIHAVIEELVGDYHIAAKEKYISLKADLPETLPPVYADADLVEQVLHNLLNNALRFAKNKIVISAQERGDGFVQIGVLDDGPGIPKEEQGRLFGKFEQLQRPQGVVGYKGTGLGLAISKEIVTQHQGKIWVETDPGRGAAFYFTLPQYDPETDFRFVLRNAAIEADRNRTPLALAVLSLDNLRGMRGKKTEQQMETLLNKMEEHLKEKTLRKKDFLFRYTLKDFVLILPQTPREGAQIISSRVEQFIRRGLQPHLQDGREPVIHAGIVVYPSDATSVERLIEIAYERKI